MTEKQLKQWDYLERMRARILRRIGPPTHFTIEEADAAIKRARDERLRREADKRRSRRK